ncbi:MAG: hypothetical protein KA436_08140 [Oligoflexales bacterium]|nr:hypothetical protein [Oligoflexales bacterium]
MNVRSLTEKNYDHSYLRFQDRQAGVSPVFAPDEGRFFYNVYCLELTLLREIFSFECEYLEDALQTVHEEFGGWELVSFEEKKGCDTCVAKK